MDTANPFEGPLKDYQRNWALSLRELVVALPEIKVSTRELTGADYETFLKTVLTNHESIHAERRHKKKLEMFISWSLLPLGPNTVFMDAAGGGFSYAGRIGAKRAFLQDLSIRPAVKKRVGPKVEYLECNAGAIPLPDESIDAMSCHHSFEHFQGNADKDFIKEIQRLLAPGGAAVIIPLFISKARLEMTNLQTFSNWSIDREHRLFDPTATLPGFKSGNFARIYDPAWLRERVLSMIDHDAFDVELFQITLDGRPVPDPDLPHYQSHKVSNFNFPYRALRITRHR